MCYTVMEDVFQVRQRRHRVSRWAKRAAGFLIVASGGFLLTTDLVNAFSTTKTSTPNNEHSALVSVSASPPAIP